MARELVGDRVKTIPRSTARPGSCRATVRRQQSFPGRAVQGVLPHHVDEGAPPLESPVETKSHPDAPEMNGLPVSK